MSLAAKVREQLIASFRAELSEHVQTMNDGLLALEQGTVEGEQRRITLEDIFRAAHSLKGAARAMGVTMVEQLAHALESALDDLQKGVVVPTTELFTACYRAIDAIQVVQAAYEAGETTPPLEALQALAELEQVRANSGSGLPTSSQPKPPVEPRETPPSAAVISDVSSQAEVEVTVAPPLLETPGMKDRTDAIEPGTPEEALETPETPVSTVPAFSADGTIRVNVGKLDTLMAQLSELLVTKIRAEQRRGQMIALRESISMWQREWTAARSAYNRLMRQMDTSGIFGFRRLGPVETAPGNEEAERESGSKSPTYVRRYETWQLTATDTSHSDLKLGKDVARLLNYIGNSQERLREIVSRVNDLTREYVSDTMHMSLVIDELEEEIKRVRMLPLATITGTFGRMVRDLAKDSGKEAVLQIVGGETELDKQVLERIKDPLIHLLRNAVGHGIEPPDRRVALGKPPVGTITLKAEQVGKEIVICVSDDGGGLDLEAVRQSLARRRGIEVGSLTEEDLKEAIFNVGVSTSPIITDISGRGVGLDVVRRNVEALHGRVDVESRPNRGTTFMLTIPLTLTSSRGLLVGVAGETFAIPHNAIERIMCVRSEEISPLEGHDTLVYDGRPITLVRLGDLLGLPTSAAGPEQDCFPVVVLATAERRMAFAVDALLGEQEVVIKSLGRQLERVGGIAGATVMGSGDVVLILNVADLIKLGLRGEYRSVLARAAWARPAPVTEERASRRILVVDDSITTRTLEKNILEAAGYEVQLATDGQEALLTIASGDLPDLIVTDVVMPHLDGFGLTQRIREDPRTENIPVILVTSLDSAEDKARGIEVGADAYITKSSFDQNSLLDTIEQLI